MTFNNKHNTPEFKAIADEHTIYQTVVGSDLHGISVGDQDDLDLMGICIEPPEYVLGLKPFEQYIYRTQPEGHRSGPGDIDLTVYSLRKWTRLALGGNPTVILPLFAPLDKVQVTSSLSGSLVRNMIPRILNKDTGRAFLGYMQAQRDRMLGLRGGRDVNRPELIERYGFDTKFAGHAVRLGIQGVQLLREGTLSLPMSQVDRDLIVGIRTGKYPQEEIVELCESYIFAIEGLLRQSTWPEHADYDLVSNWLADMYQQWWEEKGLL